MGAGRVSDKPTRATGPPRRNSPETGTFAIPAGARQLKVSPEESLLQILVYRGGAMARLGHNHVIASHQLSGVVYLTDDPLATRFDIQLPVNELTVDEPALREAAGADFPPGVPQSARDGTRDQPAVRGAARWVELPDDPAARHGYPGRRRGLRRRCRSDAQGRDAGAARPGHVSSAATGAIVARGEFPLTQSQFGLKPFSVAMGTLVVLDEMRVRFEVTHGSR